MSSTKSQVVAPAAVGVSWQSWVRQAAPMVLAGVAGAVIPLLRGDPNTIRLLFIAYVWVTTSIAWNILGGFTGQVSFGFAVFYGLGAYTTALLITRASLHPYLAYLAGGVLAALASLVIGVPAFRLRGPYFAIATIGVSETVRVIANNLKLTGGASGFRVVERRPFNQLEHYYVALLVALGALALTLVLARTRAGLAMRAVRDDQDAAAAVGIDPFRWKLIAHALAALLTGIAGGVFARYAAFIHPGGVFAFQTGVAILLMPVIGGLGTLWGPVFGGLIYGIVQEQLIARFPQIHLLLYGILLILIILFEPGGLVGLARRVQRRLSAGRGRGS